MPTPWPRRGEDLPPPLSQDENRFCPGCTGIGYCPSNDLAQHYESVLRRMALDFDEHGEPTFMARWAMDALLGIR